MISHKTWHKLWLLAMTGCAKKKEIVVKKRREGEVAGLLIENSMLWQKEPKQWGARHQGKKAKDGGRRRKGSSEGEEERKGCLAADGSFRLLAHKGNWIADRCWHVAAE